jgi:hypothetical protein
MALLTNRGRRRLLMADTAVGGAANQNVAVHVGCLNVAVATGA